MLKVSDQGKVSRPSYLSALLGASSGQSWNLLIHGFCNSSTPVYTAGDPVITHTVHHLQPKVREAVCAGSGNLPLLPRLRRKMKCGKSWLLPDIHKLSFFFSDQIFLMDVVGISHSSVGIHCGRDILFVEEALIDERPLKRYYTHAHTHTAQHSIASPPGIWDKQLFMKSC